MSSGSTRTFSTWKTKGFAGLAGEDLSASLQCDAAEDREISSSSSAPDFTTGGASFELGVFSSSNQWQEEKRTSPNWLKSRYDQRKQNHCGIDIGKAHTIFFYLSRTSINNEQRQDADLVMQLGN